MFIYAGPAGCFRIFVYLLSQCIVLCICESLPICTKFVANYDFVFSLFVNFVLLLYFCKILFYFLISYCQHQGTTIEWFLTL